LFTSTIIIIYACVSGDPKMLMLPYEANHNACGLSADVIDYPYIYFAAPLSTTRKLYATVCVKTCPVGNEKTI